MNRLPLSLIAFLVFSLIGHVSAEPLPMKVGPEDPHILYSGRMEKQKDGGICQSYSGARIRLAFEGDAVGMWLESGGDNWMNVFLDGNWISKIHTPKAADGSAYYELANGLDSGIHTIELVKATEGSVGTVTFLGFALSEAAKPVPWPHEQNRRIEFIGDSITCGYGIEVDDPKLHFEPATENFCNTYAWHAARALDADYLVVARSGIGMLRNYNGPREGSKDNMPAIYPGALFRKPEPVWDPAVFPPDVICINLGTNDFSTKGPDLTLFESSYQDFVGMLKQRNPKAKIVLLTGPMQNGDTIKGILNRIVEKANRETNSVSFFELSKQGAHGLGADYHPSRKQGEVNGAELAGYLSSLMGWDLAKPESMEPMGTP